MANMLGALNEDRPIILRKLMAMDSKLDLLLENQKDESNLGTFPAGHWERENERGVSSSQ